jgi:hypothetical protein
MPSLGKDLAAVRIKNDLSIEEVQKITKIPAHILHYIEDDSIFTRIDENTTYIRSYVRSYAKAIGISEAEIVHALDQVEAGNYGGSLAETTHPDQEPVDDIEAPDDSNKSDMVHDHSPKFALDKEEKKTSDPGTKRDKSKKTIRQSDTISSIDWVDIGRNLNTSQSRFNMQSILIIVSVLMAFGAIFLLYNYYDSGSTDSTNLQESNTIFEPETPSDSLRESLIGGESEPATNANPAAEEGTLSDTLSIAIYAANGNLDPVRVYTDILGRINPFWVREGDTTRINFVNVIRIRADEEYDQRLLDRLQLLFNGHIIQNFYQQYYNPESKMIELERSVFENHPEWWQSI